MKPGALHVRPVPGLHASQFGRPAPTTKVYDWLLLSTDSKEDPNMVITQILSVCYTRLSLLLLFKKNI